MKKIFISILVSILVLPVIVCADEFVMIKGKGCEVCEAYEKNLNSLSKPKSPTYRRINPEFKDFSTPKWMSLNNVWGAKVPPDANLNLKISDFLWKRDVNPAKYFRGDLSKWHGTKKQYADAYKRYCYFRHEISRWKVPNNHLVAEVDIDNDGVPELVYLDQMYSPPTLLLVLKPDYSDIDYEKTKLVMMHPSRKEAGLKDVRELSSNEREKNPALKNWTKITTDDAFNSLYYGVFIYKNKTYFDLWGLGDSGFYGTLDPENRLRVFLCEKGKTSEICTYKSVFADK